MDNPTKNLSKPTEKPKKRMVSTIKQRKLARKIIEITNKGEAPTKEALLRSVGYSVASSQGHAQEIIESEGVQNALDEYGFTEENAKKVLASILNSPTVFEMVTPDNQIRAAQEVFKVRGSYAPAKSETKALNIDVKIDNSETEKLRQEYEQKLNETFRRIDSRLDSGKPN